MAWIQFLVQEPRSCKLHGVAKGKKSKSWTALSPASSSLQRVVCSTHTLSANPLSGPWLRFLPQPLPNPPGNRLVTSYHPTLTHCLILDGVPTSSALIPPVTVAGLPASTPFSQVSSQRSSQSDPLKLKSDHVSLLLQALQSFLASLRVKVRGQQSPRRSAPWLPSPPLFIPSHASLFRLLSPSVALPPGTWWAGQGGFALDAPSAWHSLPHISASLTPYCLQVFLKC